MTDLSFQLLQNALHQCEGNNLWLVDENIDLTQSVSAPDNTVAISNRYDIQQALLKKSVDCTFNDFDFSPIEDNSIDNIFFRVSKEKAVVHHIINQAARTLKTDGELYLSGYKNDGIKTYADKAQQLLQGSKDKSNGGKSSHLFKLSKKAVNTENVLDDKNYRSLTTLTQPDESELFTKPGQFGWNKTDKGSEFLINELPRFLDGIRKPPETLLDLGCGYGYLTLMVEKELNLNRIVATDNNAAAVLSCKKNVQSFTFNVDVIADDCAEHINEKFELIVCNPPFHQGFSTDNSLTERFTEQACRHLRPKGSAFFVVNQFIPLEKIAEDYFNNIEVFASNKSFKLIKCTLPKRRRF